MRNSYIVGDVGFLAVNYNSYKSILLTYSNITCTTTNTNGASVFALFRHIGL